MPAGRLINGDTADILQTSNRHTLAGENDATVGKTEPSTDPHCGFPCTESLSTENILFALGLHEVC